MKSSQNHLHGPECNWCSKKKTLKSLVHSHPSGSDLTSTGENFNKKALLIGINYLDEIKSNRLKGCINDAYEMKNFLYKQFRITNSRLLCDNHTNRKRLPTRKNILNSIQWLVDKAKPGDNLIFPFLWTWETDP